MKKNKGTIPGMPLLWYNRTYRLAWVFFLWAIFFITAPITILYTIGYRYNLKDGVFHQSGVLSVDIAPKNAQIFLNNRLVGKKSPLRLTNLVPGTYTVSLSAPGYHTWRTDVLIEPQKTTYIKSVELFRELLPEFVNQNTDMPKNVQTSFDGSYAFFSYQKNGVTDVMLWDSASRTSETVYRSNKPAEYIRTGWAPFSSFGYISETRNTSTALMLFLNKEQTAAYTLSSTNTVAEWVRTNTGDTLAITFASSSIAEINKDGLRIFQSSTLIENKWLIDTKHHAWSWNNQKGSIVRIDDEMVRFAFPENMAKESIASDDRRVAMRGTNNELLLFTHGSDIFHDTFYAPTGTFTWNAFTNEWIIVTPQEITAIYPDGTDTLLLRNSGSYRGAYPMDNFGVLLLEEPETLTAFNPGYYTSQILFQFGNISRAFVYPKDRTIFFFGSVGNTHGLFSLGY